MLTTIFMALVLLCAAVGLGALVVEIALSRRKRWAEMAEEDTVSPAPVRREQVPPPPPGPVAEVETIRLQPSRARPGPPSDVPTAPVIGLPDVSGPSIDEEPTHSELWGLGPPSEQPSPLRDHGPSITPGPSPTFNPPPPPWARKTQSQPPRKRPRRKQDGPAFEPLAPQDRDRIPVGAIRKPRALRRAAASGMGGAPSDVPTSPAFEIPDELFPSEPTDEQEKTWELGYPSAHPPPGREGVPASNPPDAAPAYKAPEIPSDAVLAVGPPAPPPALRTINPMVPPPAPPKTLSRATTVKPLGPPPRRSDRDEGSTYEELIDEDELARLARSEFEVDEDRRDRRPASHKTPLPPHRVDDESDEPPRMVQMYFIALEDDDEDVSDVETVSASPEDLRLIRETLSSRDTMDED